MATFAPKELLMFWKQETITVAMAIGHLIQNMVQQQATIETLQQRVATLQATVDQLAAQQSAASAGSGKRGK